MQSIKYTLLVKPCQSGKTFSMFNSMVDIFRDEDDDSTSSVNVIFCDNSILQTIQTCTRLDKDARFSEFKTDGGDLSLVLSSKSNVESYEKIPYYLLKGYRNVVMCSNSIRANDLNKLVKLLTIFKFNIWIDEIDRNLNLFEPFLSKWCKLSNVERITLITATPSKPLKSLGNMNIVKLEKTYNRETYHLFRDSSFVFFEDEKNTSSYVQTILKTHKKLLKPKTVWFIPTDVKKVSHYEIQKYCRESNVNCLTINSDGMKLYANKIYLIKPSSKKELSKILGQVYHKFQLKTKPFAITGNLCISRGVTISSKRMMITHAIFPPKINNTDSSYQMAGRVCGNTKLFPNWLKPTVFCTKKLHKKVIARETKAANVAEKAFKENRDTVTHSEYNVSDSAYDFFQAGPYDDVAKAYCFLKTKFKKMRRVKSWVIDEEFNISTFLLGYTHHVRKANLKKEHRLEKSVMENIPKSYNLKGKGSKYRVFPVYNTMDDDDKTCHWYVRYKLPVENDLDD